MRMPGIAITPSMTRISGPSSQRMYPALRPARMPNASATIATATPTMSDTRVP